VAPSRYRKPGGCGAGFPFGCHAGRRAAVTAAALAATLGLAAVCWVVAVRQMNGMDMRLPPGVVRSGYLQACGWR
jgi:hypothetical protein